MFPWEWQCKWIHCMPPGDRPVGVLWSAAEKQATALVVKLIACLSVPLSGKTLMWDIGWVSVRNPLLQKPIIFQWKPHNYWQNMFNIKHWCNSASVFDEWIIKSGLPLVLTYYVVQLSQCYSIPTYEQWNCWVFCYQLRHKHTQTSC